jgi:hypothetical protein
MGVRLLIGAKHTTIWWCETTNYRFLTKFYENYKQMHSQLIGRESHHNLPAAIH